MPIAPIRRLAPPGRTQGGKTAATDTEARSIEQRDVRPPPAHHSPAAYSARARYFVRGAPILRFVHTGIAPARYSSKIIFNKNKYQKCRLMPPFPIFPKRNGN
jgi:hypothetical protein